MSANKTIKEISALRDAAIDDLMSMSDEELRAEAKDDGEDLEAIASEVRRTMRETAAAALRSRMSATRVSQPLAAAPQRAHSVARPSLERIKQIVQQLFEQKPQVGLAFRDGKRQSESDWQNLYDDLISVGALKAENDDH